MNFQYQLIRTRRKSLSLSIGADAQITVRAPKGLQDKHIESFISSKKIWIEKKVLEMSERPRAAEKTIKNGEEFAYLGRNYPLKLVEGQRRPLIFDGICFSLKNPSVGPKIIFNWYKTQARKIIAGRAFQIAQSYGCNYKKLRIMTAKSRWGSCNSVSTISFNWKLILAPLWIVDYVICHELAHLKHLNHSQEFWQLVETMYPNYREAKKWLKINGNTLDLILISHE